MTAAVRLVPLSRNPDDYYRTATEYAMACPGCGAFGVVFRDVRGWWSLCGCIGDPKRPLDDFDARRRIAYLVAA